MTEKRLEIFWNYLKFVENLTDEQSVNSRLGSLCEIAELKFLARLPRNLKPQQLISYIETMSRKFDADYDGFYLVKRWQKIFIENQFSSNLDAWPIISERDRHICQYCIGTLNLEAHHVIPSDRNKYGGLNSTNNLVLACKPCNIKISNSIRLPRNWWQLHPDSRNKPTVA